MCTPLVLTVEELDLNIFGFQGPGLVCGDSGYKHGEARSAFSCDTVYFHCLLVLLVQRVDES